MVVLGKFIAKPINNLAANTALNLTRGFWYFCSAVEMRTAKIPWKLGAPRAGYLGRSATKKISQVLLPRKQSVGEDIIDEVVFRAMSYYGGF